MTDEQDVFDPTLTKKKKKKPFGLDENEAMQEETPVILHPPSNDKPTDEANADGDLLDLTLDKKKKKKKKPIDLTDLGSALPEQQGNDEVEEDEQQPEEDNSIDFTQKKKKKKKDKGLTDTANEKEETDGTTETAVQSESDYAYEELLARVFEKMMEKNPDMVAGEKKKFVMKPPQVMKVGTKKSSFVNFAEICRLLHRQPKHLLDFLLSELGTTGSVDINNQLIIKGRFQQNQIESVLRRYIKEYVTCHTCKSPATMLQKETRLYFLQCETCGSRCSVTSIKTGFQAVTGKRAAIRAKAAE